jgi:phospholipid transport system substrate-binding protein
MMIIKTTLFAVLAMASAASFAEKNADDEKMPAAPAAVVELNAQETVYNFANNVIGSIRDKDEGTTSFDAIKPHLDSMVAYSSVVKGVMGDYSKAANKNQKKTFLLAFRQSLIDTFAQGFEIFVDYEISLSELQDENSSKTNTIVYLDMKSPEGEVYKIALTMYYQEKNKKWRMLNAILNGVNLGILFRNQYQQLVAEAEGNIDETTRLWLIEMQKQYEKQLEVFESE